MRHNFLGVVWLSCVVGHCWLIIVPVTDAQPQEAKPEQHLQAKREFSLRSDPLPTPITFPGDPQSAQMTTIELIGKVPDGDTGSAELTLGENTYSFNAFGDAEVAKQKPPRKFEVQLRRKSLNRYAEAFEVTSADLPLQEQLFVIRRTMPRLESELLIGNPRLDNSSQGTIISLQPRQRVDLYDQPPQATDPKYRQSLRKHVGLYNNRFRLIEAKEDRLGMIDIYGELGGKASLTHDLNYFGYQLSPKGITASSTAVAYRPQSVRLIQLDLADPAKQNRRIYRVDFETPSDPNTSLVVGPEAIGPHRLVLSHDGKVNRVLPLQCNGVALWEDLQPETLKLPAPERTAIAQLSDAVPCNFFYGYRIKDQHVVSVNLYGNDVSRESLAVLPGFPQLQYVSIYGHEADAADLAGVVKQLSALKSYRGEDIQVSDALFKAIAELPELVSLSISSHKEASPITDEQLELLSHSRSIKKLYLAAEKASDVGLLSLADMPQLSALDLSAQLLTAKAAKEFCSRRPNCKVTINGDKYRSNPTPMK